MVHTDSSKAAAGMFCGGDWCYVHWKKDLPDVYPLHINYKEVVAILLAADRWAPLRSGSDVTVVTDSIVAKAIVNKGTCKNHKVMDALRDLFWLQVKFNFRLRAIHIPGKLNQLPDAISRLHEPGQALRLQSLLSNWHSTPQYPDTSCLDTHMSYSAFQVLQPRPKQVNFMLY